MIGKFTRKYGEINPRYPRILGGPTLFLESQRSKLGKCWISFCQNIFGLGGIICQKGVVGAKKNLLTL
jgi:hypothetical protein